MAQAPSGSTQWVMWIGARQWEGQPGKFDIGQSGWVYPKDELAGLLTFFPALGRYSAWSYRVVCVMKDFLRFTTLENA